MWKILVADDDFVNRKLLVEILKSHAECDVAADGNEAIEAYELSVKQSDPYDVILLDISMPGKDGMEVLTHVRKQEEKKDIMLGAGVPIIMVTAHREPFLDAFNKGCDDYILKPINAQLLISKIEEKAVK